MEKTSEQLLLQARECLRRGKAYESEQLCRAVLGRQPDHAIVWQLLGISLAAQGRSHDAISAFNRAAALRPSPELLYNLGKAHQETGNRQQAIEAYRQAIVMRPAYVEAHHNLGIVLRETGKLDEAIQTARQVVRLSAGFADGYSNLAGALVDAQQPEEAAEMYRKAIALRPSDAQSLAGLGSALAMMRQIDGSSAVLRSALEIDPNLAQAHNTLGNIAKDIGHIDEALRHYQHAISINDAPWAWDNYLYSLYFHPSFDSRQIFEEHRKWNEKFARPLEREIQPNANDRSSDRRLRIGYVSAHFRRHPVGRFLLPLLENHNHGEFEIVCYCGNTHSDPLTQKMIGMADAWKPTNGWSDEELAAQVREDRIDILCDLTLHMEGSRLLTFARKPAPIQVTYLAYCGTTGLETIDYRLSDPHLDPCRAGIARQSPDKTGDYAEETIRLASYWCYQARFEAPAPLPPPDSKAGFITFGCLNNYSKVTASTWELWIDVMRAIPKSRLLLHCPPGAHRQEMLDNVARHGIETNRIEFVGTTSFQQYFQLYNRVDIALDPTPCCGGTTTCDALWMGVPVVSLSGQTAVSRAGLSILSAIGLPELVACNAQQYVQIASSLAGDSSRLSDLRSGLRDQMQSSPLMDGPSFARDFESILRKMWHRWCESGTLPSGS